MANVVIGEIDIQVIKKNIKNMHLSVLPPNGIVRVSVPLSIDDDAIRLFIISKIGKFSSFEINSYLIHIFQFNFFNHFWIIS